MALVIEVEQEEDGRWLAEVSELPGVLAYGRTRQEAVGKVQALALRAFADRLENGANGLPASDSGSPPVRAWPQLLDDLLVIRRLGDDWDGQGAEAPDPALVDWAITLAQDFQANGVLPADRVIAGVGGGILFEWHRPAGYLEIEVTAPEEVEGRLVRKGAEAAEAFSLSRHC